MNHETFLEELAAVLGEAEDGGGADPLALLGGPARAHLADCSPCRRIAEGLAHGGGALFGDDPPAGYREDFSRRLAARLQAEGLRGHEAKRLAGPWALPRARWLLAAAAVLAVALGLALRGGPPGPTEPTEQATNDGAASAPALAAPAVDDSLETDPETLAAVSLDAAFGRTDFLGSFDDDSLPSEPDWDALDNSDSPLLSGEALRLLGDTLEASLDAEAAAELARRIREDMTS